MKMLNKCIIVFFVTFAFFDASTAVQPDFKLDSISCDHINTKAKRYYKKFCHTKNTKMFTSSVLGLAVAVAIVLYVYSQYTQSDDTKDDTLATVLIQDANDIIKKAKAEKIKRKFSFFKTLSKDIRNSVIGVLVLIVVDSLNKTVGVGKSLLADFISWGNVDNAKILKDKFSNLKELLIKFANIPDLNENQKKELHTNQALTEIELFDLSMTHGSLIHFIEDILAFIKFLTMLDSEMDESNDLIFDKNCIIFASEFNEITKLVSTIMNANGDQTANKQIVMSMYAIFCRKFTQFICEYGVTLYGQNFLQK